MSKPNHSVMVPATAPAAAKENAAPFSPAPEVADVLAKAGRLLSDGQTDAALDLIARARVKSDWLTNALAVCQLRRGEPQKAVDLLRSVVITGGGVIVRDDVPVAFKTNYATGLLLTGNINGFQSVMANVGGHDHPAAAKLTAALKQWKQNFTFWERLSWYTGGQVQRPVTLDFPAGDLE